MKGGAAAILGIAAALTAAVAPRASADVRITPDRVVVSGRGAMAIVERRPLRIRFADRAGRVFLEQVAADGSGPVVVPPLPDQLPAGSDAVKRPSLYAPFSFIVGAERDVQFPVTQWAGDQLIGLEAGTQYSGREVVGVRPTGRGVELSVSTSDPSGRMLKVTLAPGPRGTIALAARPDPADGVAVMADSFSSPAGEAFHGFGGRHNALDQRGEDFYNWIEQENLGAGRLAPVVEPLPGNHGDRYMFPGGSSGAYYAQAQFLSSRGYGFLLDRPEISRWRMASDRADAWQVSVGAPALDYVVAPGGVRRAIANLTAISGRHSVPPAWGVGSQMDREVRFPNETHDSYLAAVDDDIAHIARGDIDVVGYRIEGWPLLSRAELADVIARLHRLGVHALLYYRAFADQSGSGGTDEPSAFTEAVDRGYAAMDPTGRPYVFLSNYNSPTVLLDFTNPATVRWWEARLRRGLDLGADGFMQDFGEQTQVDMRFHDGSTGAEMHNRFPIVYHSVTRRFMDRYRREHPGRRLFWYTRSGYSGTPGSAAFEPSNFPGDETTDWERSSGLASLATDMLNRAVGGAYGFNTDIGGYFDIGPYETTTKELLIRWAEWAALSPHFRLHGAVGAGTHTPWSFDRQTVEIYKRIARLHRRAEPLILALWRRARRTGIPPTRPLWLSYPGDSEAARQDQEWMLGPHVLVAPVVAEGATSRSVYFPRGCWRRPETGDVYRGPRDATVQAPLESLPYFVRCRTRPFALRRRHAAARTIGSR